MGWIDHIGRFDESRSHVTCRCGAKYSIYEDDGMPGCRDIEIVNCRFCDAELARHFGTCEGTVIDDSAVPDGLKAARKKYDATVQTYIKQHGYNWGTPEYAEILKCWRNAVDKCMNENEA